MRPTKYILRNRQTGQERTYKTRQAATRAADKADWAYGAVICSVQPVWEA